MNNNITMITNYFFTQLADLNTRSKFCVEYLDENIWNHVHIDYMELFYWFNDTKATFDVQLVTPSDLQHIESVRASFIVIHFNKPDWKTTCAEKLIIKANRGCTDSETS